MIDRTAISVNIAETNGWKFEPVVAPVLFVASLSGVLTTRLCLDCAKPISKRSKARCRSCGMSAVNRLPEKRATARSTMLTNREDGTFMARSIATRCWCPPEHIQFNRKLRRHGYSPAERQQMVNEAILKGASA